MKATHTFAFGLTAALVAGSFVFTNAIGRTAPEAAPAATIVLASAETPQDQVWDMTYGAEKPVAIAEVAHPSEDTSNVTDLSMG